MYLAKTKSGTFIPVHNYDRTLADKIPIGAEIYATLARNPDFHRKAMALFRMGYENQDFYTIEEIYRKEVIMAAGYYHEYSKPDGEIVKTAKSISFEKMGEIEFQEVFRACREVVAQQLKLSDEQVLNELEGFY